MKIHLVLDAPMEGVPPENLYAMAANMELRLKTVLDIEYTPSNSGVKQRSELVGYSVEEIPDYQPRVIATLESGNGEEK